MKNLQLLMAMSLVVGSSQIYSEEYNEEDQNEAIQSQMRATLDHQATLEVLADLTESHPDVVERIIENEEDLDSNFNSIKKFIEKKIKEIEILLKENSVQETEIARLAVELVDAQAMLQKYMAEQRARNKRNPSREQVIKDSLIKAEQGLRNLNKKAARGFSDLGRSMNKFGKQVKNSKASKAVVKASEDMIDFMADAGESILDASKEAGSYVAQGSQNYLINEGRRTERMATDPVGAYIEGFTANPFRTPKKMQQ